MKHLSYCTNVSVSETSKRTRTAAAQNELEDRCVFCSRLREHHIHMFLDVTSNDGPLTRRYQERGQKIRQRTQLNNKTKEERIETRLTSLKIQRILCAVTEFCGFQDKELETSAQDGRGRTCTRSIGTVQEHFARGECHVYTAQ